MSLPLHEGRDMLITVLVILSVIALVGGGWGHTRWGVMGWSPVGLILLIALVLWFTGYIHQGQGFH